MSPDAKEFFAVYDPQVRFLKKEEQEKEGEQEKLIEALPLFGRPVQAGCIRSERPGRDVCQAGRVDPAEGCPRLPGAETSILGPNSRALAPHAGIRFTTLFGTGFGAVKRDGIERTSWVCRL